MPLEDDIVDNDEVRRKPFRCALDGAASAECAVLLDIDGTLLDLMPTPREVWVPPGLARRSVVCMSAPAARWRGQRTLAQRHRI